MNSVRDSRHKRNLVVRVDEAGLSIQPKTGGPAEFKERKKWRAWGDSEPARRPYGCSVGTSAES